MMQQCHSFQCYSAGECSCGAFHGQTNYYSYIDHSDTYSFESSSPVDCTLSLGTPSTRLTEYDERRREEQQASKHATSFRRTSRAGNGAADRASAADQMFARHCAHCNTDTTPLWRNGPNGPKSLCNACGIRYKKEERRAASSGQTSSWLPHHSQSQRTQRFSGDLNSGVAFLSWSLNETEQPQLYYDFTS